MRDVTARVVDVRLEQDRIPRGLVDLNSIPTGKNSLELSTVVSGSAAHQSHARRIEAEFVLNQASTCDHPVRARRQEIDEAAFAILRRDHFVRAEDAEVFRNQGIPSNSLSYREGDINGI